MLYPDYGNKIKRKIKQVVNTVHAQSGKFAADDLKHTLHGSLIREENGQNWSASLSAQEQLLISNLRNFKQGISNKFNTDQLPTNLQVDTDAYVRLHANNLHPVVQEPNKTLLSWLEKYLALPADLISQQLETHTNELLVQNTLIPRLLNAIAKLQEEASLLELKLGGVKEDFCFEELELNEIFALKEQLKVARSPNESLDVSTLQSLIEKIKRGALQAELFHEKRLAEVKAHSYAPLISNINVVTEVYKNEQLKTLTQPTYAVNHYTAKRLVGKELFPYALHSNANAIFINTVLRETQNRTIRTISNIYFSALHNLALSRYTDALAFLGSYSLPINKQRNVDNGVLNINFALHELQQLAEILNYLYSFDANELTPDCEIVEQINQLTVLLKPNRWNEFKAKLSKIAKIAAKLKKEKEEKRVSLLTKDKVALVKFTKDDYDLQNLFKDNQRDLYQAVNVSLIDDSPSLRELTILEFNTNALAIPAFWQENKLWNAKVSIEVNTAIYADHGLAILRGYVKRPLYNRLVANSRLDNLYDLGKTALWLGKLYQLKPEPLKLDDRNVKDPYKPKSNAFENSLKVGFNYNDRVSAYPDFNAPIEGLTVGSFNYYDAYLFIKQIQSYPQLNIELQKKDKNLVWLFVGNRKAFQPYENLISYTKPNFYHYGIDVIKTSFKYNRNLPLTQWQQMKPLAEIFNLWLAEVSVRAVRTYKSRDFKYAINEFLANMYITLDSGINETYSFFASEANHHIGDLLFGRELAYEVRTPEIHPYFYRRFLIAMPSYDVYRYNVYLRGQLDFEHGYSDYEMQMLNHLFTSRINFQVPYTEDINRMSNRRLFNDIYPLVGGANIMLREQYYQLASEIYNFTPTNELTEQVTIENRHTRYALGLFDSDANSYNRLLAQGRSAFVEHLDMRQRFESLYIYKRLGQNPFGYVNWHSNHKTITHSLEHSFYNLRDLGEVYSLYHDKFTRFQELRNKELLEIHADHLVGELIPQEYVNFKDKLQKKQFRSSYFETLSTYPAMVRFKVLKEQDKSGEYRSNFLKQAFAYEEEVELDQKALKLKGQKGEVNRYITRTLGNSLYHLSLSEYFVNVINTRFAFPKIYKILDTNEAISVTNYQFDQELLKHAYNYKSSTIKIAQLNNPLFKAAALESYYFKQIENSILSSRFIQSKGVFSGLPQRLANFSGLPYDQLYESLHGICKRLILIRDLLERFPQALRAGIKHKVSESVLANSDLLLSLQMRLNTPARSLQRWGANVPSNENNLDAMWQVQLQVDFTNQLTNTIENGSYYLVKAIESDKYAIVRLEKILDQQGQEQVIVHNCFNLQADFNRDEYSKELNRRSIKDLITSTMTDAEIDKVIARTNYSKQFSLLNPWQKYKIRKLFKDVPGLFATLVNFKPYARELESQVQGQGIDLSWYAQPISYSAVNEVNLSLALPTQGCGEFVIIDANGKVEPINTYQQEQKRDEVNVKHVFAQAAKNKGQTAKEHQANYAYSQATKFATLRFKRIEDFFATYQVLGYASQVVAVPSSVEELILSARADENMAYNMYDILTTTPVGLVTNFTQLGIYSNGKFSLEGLLNLIDHVNSADTELQRQVVLSRYLAPIFQRPVAQYFDFVTRYLGKDQIAIDYDKLELNHQSSAVLDSGIAQNVLIEFKNTHQADMQLINAKVPEELVSSAYLYQKLHQQGRTSIQELLTNKTFVPRELNYLNIIKQDYDLASLEIKDEVTKEESLVAKFAPSSLAAQIESNNLHLGKVILRQEQKVITGDKVLVNTINLEQKSQVADLLLEPQHTSNYHELQVNGKKVKGANLLASAIIAFNSSDLEQQNSESSNSFQLLTKLENKIKESKSKKIQENTSSVSTDTFIDLISPYSDNLENLITNKCSLVNKSQVVKDEVIPTKETIVSSQVSEPNSDKVKEDLAVAAKTALQAVGITQERYMHMSLNKHKQYNVEVLAAALASSRYKLEAANILYQTSYNPGAYVTMQHFILGSIGKVQGDVTTYPTLYQMSFRNQAKDQQFDIDDVHTFTNLIQKQRYLVNLSSSALGDSQAKAIHNFTIAIAQFSVKDHKEVANRIGISNKINLLEVGSFDHTGNLYHEFNRLYAVNFKKYFEKKSFKALQASVADGYEVLFTNENQRLITLGLPKLQDRYTYSLNVERYNHNVNLPVISSVIADSKYQRFYAGDTQAYELLKVFSSTLYNPMLGMLEQRADSNFTTEHWLKYDKIIYSDNTLQPLFIKLS